MTSPSPLDQAALPVSRKLQLDQVCDQFEAAWKVAGVRSAVPRLEDYVAGVPEPEHDILLRELIVLDFDYRRRAGQELQASAYASRFPGLDPGWLEQQLASFRTAMPSEATPPPPATPGAGSAGPRQQLSSPLGQQPSALAAAPSDQALCPACGGMYRVCEAVPTLSTGPGRELGKFEILERVGVGAFGAVWKARDTVLDRIVALKIPHAGLLTSADDLERFRREGRAAAQLRHPGIVPVHEVVTLEGLPVLVADFVEGVPLKELLHTKRLAFREAAGLVAEVALALDYAHGMGLVHRDIKPGNILLDDGRRAAGMSGAEVARLGAGLPPRSRATSATDAKVPTATTLGVGRPLITDFGLALRVAAEATLTQEGQVLGTPAYMSPEQAAGQGHRVDRRSDVYSLGVVLYELLSGERPFRGSAEMLLWQVLHDEPRPPRQLNDQIPRDLESICLKAMAKLPPRRYDTARELAEDLRRWLQGEPIRARPVSTTERLGRWCQRNPAVAALAGAVGLLLLASTVGATLFAVRERGLAEAAERAGEQTVAALLEEQAARAAANEASAEEQAQRRRAEDLLERQYVAQAVRLMNDGDLVGSLPWLVECLRLARGDSAREEMHRYRLAGVLQQSPRLVQVWFHEGQVQRAEFSPDGRCVVTASMDHTARVWEVATGKPVTPPLKHSNAVGHAAFSPDGRYVVTASEDSTARIWDAATGKPVTPPLRHGTTVVYATFSPDGRHVVTASEDSTAQVWNAATGTPVGPRLKHGQKVFYAAFSPEGRRVVTASGDGTAQIWDAVTGAAVGRPLKPGRGVGCAVFSPDGRYLVTTSGPAAQVWDAATGAPVGSPLEHGNSLRWACFSPDGRRVLTASHDGTARVWDAATGKGVTPFLKHSGPVIHAAFSPDGQRVVTASTDRTARVWNAATGTLVAPILRHSGLVWRAAFSPDGRRVLTASADGTARLWDLGSGEPSIPPLRHDRLVYTASFSSDGRRLVTASWDKTARVWDAATGTPVSPPLPHTEVVQHAAFSSDGGRVVTASHDNTAQVWDATTGERIGPPLKHKDRVLYAEFSPDGRHVITASQDKTAQVWEAATGNPVCPSLRHEGSVPHASFSPDGRRVVTATSEYAAQVWDAATGVALGSPLKHGYPVNWACFSPDGRRVVTASVDGGRVWDAATGEPVTPLLKHSGQVRRATFSRDGRRVVTASTDQTARVWDAVTGEPVSPPLRHGGDVLEAAFSPDGRRVLTASSTDPRVWIWDVATGQPAAPPLQHSDAVWHAAFSSDGRRLVTACGDGAARVWELPFDERPLPDLVLLAQVLAGVEMRTPDQFLPLETAPFCAGWAALWAKYPQDFPASPPEQLLGLEWKLPYWRGRAHAQVGQWDRAFAEYSQALALAPKDARPWVERGRIHASRSQWDQAVADYTRALELGPAEAGLWIERARAHVNQNHWDQAVADYTRALELGPAEAGLWIERARAHVNQNHWDQAAADYTRAIELAPENPELVAWRGRAHAALEQQEKAAADYARACQLDSNDRMVWSMHACFLVHAGYTNSYRHFCARLLERFGDTKDPHTALWMARTCLLVPNAVGDPTRLVGLAEQAAAGSPQEPMYLSVLATAHYRAGQFDQAVRWARAADETKHRSKNPWDGKVLPSWLIQAMAHHRLGHIHEARQWLEKAVQWMNENTDQKPEHSFPIAPFNWWHERRVFEILRREAEAVLRDP